MAGGICKSLEAVEDGLHRLDRRVLLAHLQEGLPPDDIRQALDSVGLLVTQDLEWLYGWRNGTSSVGPTLDDIHLFPGFYLLSIQGAVASYKAFVSDSRWQAGWLPVSANGGGDFYVVDLSNGESVRHFWIDEVEHPVEFSSLAAMLETLARAFDRKVFFVDASGFLEMDDLVFSGLATELNPDVLYWRSLG